MPIVHTSDGRTVEFPDGMSQQDMAAALKKLPPMHASQPAQTPTQTADTPWYNTPLGIGALGPLNVMRPDYMSGMGKSFINSAYNVGRGVVNAAQDMPADTSRNPDFEAGLKPQNTAEKVGNVAGNVAQFVAPSGMAGKLTKAMEVGGKIGPVVNALTRFGVQGGTQGLTSLAQGGEFTGPALMGGVMSAAEPAIDAGARNLAYGIVNRNVLRSKPNQFITGANPGRAVVDNGIVNMTQGGLADSIAAEKNASGQIVGQQTAKIPGTFNPTPELNGAVDKQVAKATVDGAPTGRLEAFRNGRMGEIAGNGSLGPTLPSQAKLPATEIADLKRSTYDAMDFGPNADSTLNTARRDYASGLNDMVRVPENANYADLAEAQKVIQRRMNAGVSMQDVIRHGMRAGVATGVGVLGGHAGGNGFKDFLLTLALENLLGSTGAQTGMAQGLRGISGAARGGLLSPLAAYAVSQRNGDNERAQYLSSKMRADNQ